MIKKTFIIIFIYLLLVSCIEHRHPTDVYPLVERAESDTKKTGLNLTNPFIVDGEIRQDVDKAIGLTGTEGDRAKRVLRYLNDRGYLNFQYQEDLNLTAIEAYRTHKGNCVTYTNLYLGICRYLRIPVYCIRVREALSFEEKEGSLLVYSHIAVGLDTPPNNMVIDLTGESESLRIYERIDDITAYCLFYNNVAVEKMLDGDTEAAEKIFRFLMNVKPDVEEVKNNFGTLLIRQGHFREALDLYMELIEGGLAYGSAYANAIIAARSLGDEQTLKKLEKKMVELSKRDPVLLFADAISKYREKRIEEAVGLLKKAIVLKPRSAALYCWLARIYLESGRTDDGISAFKKGMRISPENRMFKELQSRFPVLN